ncbi:unnamed protein product [Agarophyton chilense]
MGNDSTHTNRQSNLFSPPLQQPQRCSPPPMLGRLQDAMYASKLKTSERLGIIHLNAKKRLNAGHRSKMAADQSRQKRQKRQELEQIRERRNAELQQKWYIERARMARARIANRRHESDVIDLTQTREHDPDFDPKVEEDEDVTHITTKARRSKSRLREKIKVRPSDAVAYEKAHEVASACSTPPRSSPTEGMEDKEKENIISLLSSDDEKNKTSRLKLCRPKRQRPQKQRMKNQRQTVLFGLPVSDCAFDPPSSDNAEEKPPPTPRINSTAERLKSPLHQIESDIEVELLRVEKSAKQKSDTKIHGPAHDGNALELKISALPAFPEQISNTKLDSVVESSDVESSVQLIQDTPFKAGMKRISEKRTIPAQSFYGTKKHANGSRAGTIDVPALKHEVNDKFHSQEIIQLELSDDEEDDVIECEPITKNGSIFTLDDYEMPGFFAKEEPSFETDVKRARDIRFRRLDPEELVILSSLTDQVPKQFVLSRIEEANIGLKGEDFARLRGSRWLNDELLNSFVALINSRNRRDVLRESNFENEEIEYSIDVDAPQEGLYSIFSRKRPRTHVFNTFFFPRLTQKGYDYSGVKRWLKRAGLSVKSLDLILIPINLNNFHWVLTAIDLRSKHFLYLDSTFGKDTSETIPILKKWLFDEVKDKHGIVAAEKMGINLWPVHINPPYLPRQQDGGSCGIFTLYMADYLERGLCPNFTQDDIRTLRRRTALFLNDGRLPN